METKKLFFCFIKFQLIPLPAAGSILTILGILIHFKWILVDFDIFPILYDPLFVTFLGIGSFLYIDNFYKEKLACQCHKGWRQKFHHLSGYATGMIASFSFYLVAGSTLFFRVFDSLSNDSIQSQNIELLSVQIPFFVALAIFGFLANFIARDVFFSIDGKSGILFNMKKTIQEQIRDFIEETKNYLLRFKNNFLNYI